ncbi:Protein of unknown function [Peptoclostridium litorale DSM 5388]|uniref:DUF2680 domain-containing protein n=1 Tax=Peptoclostridium litorale DSM 5388 TaxID=1121324 RepID=A0A069RHI1_PEPLI|nr:DUF2680 domain-containing protein [Peptoclostridium litorale]KDR96243.1 hypothetical protein CLIT_4c00800 [Peptoclostridium litorale DSM 5388]SIO14329.1 Protein of unknown function [Peptoclostridium litorale DSM 5388]
MKKLKKLTKIIIGGVMVISLGAVAFADSVMTPAQVYSDVTGKTVEEAYEDRQSGKTYGELAQEEGKYEEFKEQLLENRKALLEERVEDGTLTREQADLMLQRMEECDGTNPGQNGFGLGRGNGGCGNGQCGFGGQGRGLGQGRGASKGFGQGQGLRQFEEK